MCLPVYKCETADCDTEVTKGTNGVYLCFPCWKNGAELELVRIIDEEREKKRHNRPARFREPSLAMQERLQKPAHITLSKWLEIKRKEKITHYKNRKKMPKE